MMAPKGETASAEIAGPGGWKARLSGVDTPYIVLGLLMILCTLIVLWQIDEQNRSRERDAVRFLEAHRTTQNLLGGITRNQMLIIEAVKNSFTAAEEATERLVYVFSLKPAEREALKLSMPASLRKQLNSR